MRIVVLIFLSICLFERGASQTPNRAVGIVFDNSGSMVRQIPKQRKIGKSLIEKLSKAGPNSISLFGFLRDDSVKPPVAKLAVLKECVSDVTLLSQQIDSVEVARGLTMLYNAIRDVAERLKSSSATNCNRVLDETSIVVFTDGIDRGSETTTDALISMLKRLKVRVFAIALLDDIYSDNVPDTSRINAIKKELAKLTAETNGRLLTSTKEKDIDLLVLELMGK
jgi:von Willebrand factor type A domain